MPGLPIADLLEAESRRRKLEGWLAVELLLHALAEELVLPETLQLLSPCANCGSGGRGFKSRPGANSTP